MQNSENFLLKKMQTVSQCSHMPKYPVCLGKRLAILKQKKGVHSDTCTNPPLIQPLKRKGNNQDCDASCWEDKEVRKSLLIF